MLYQQYMFLFHQKLSSGLYQCRSKMKVDKFGSSLRGLRAPYLLLSGQVLPTKLEEILYYKIHNPPVNQRLSSYEKS